MTSTKMTLGLALLLGLLAAGCGDDSNNNADTGTTDTGTTDGGMTDTGTTADTGTTDTGTTDSGTGTDFPTAQRDAVAGFCACDFADMGFATAAECTTASLPGAAAAACIASAIDSNPAVQPFFDCLASLLANQATCYGAAACDATATSACDDTAGGARDACPEPGMAVGQAYTDALDSCNAMNVVGSAGTCPNTSGAINMLGDAVFTGTTVAMGNDVENGCGSDTGGAPDQVLQWAAPADGSYVIDSQGSLYDTVLQVQDACDSSDFYDCNDDADDGDLGLRSRVTIGPLTAGQVVLIVIDGWDGSAAGDYVINIHDAPATMTDAGVDSGTDAGTDAGADAGVDSGTDAGADAGVDSGTGV